MAFDEVFAPFIEQSPVSVMFRGTLEKIFASERLDEIFEENVTRQRVGKVAFSTCAELLGLVVTRQVPSVNSAYHKKKDEMSVAVKSIYNKLSGMDLSVSEALVRETAKDLNATIKEMCAVSPSPLPGYELRIVDGNQLRRTHHRLKELRTIGDAPLPGKTISVLNPQSEIIEDVIACEDGHASQKPQFRHLLPKVMSGQCWIADREYSTKAFLFGIKARKAHFVIRQHSVLQGKAVGQEKRVGKTKTGVVYEQDMRITDSEGNELTVRRVTLKLNNATRNKSTEIHLLSNLPRKVSAVKVADVYQTRWRIETAFQKLTTVLRCELNTLGYPDAALFGFCIAVVMYNVVSTVVAALRTAHPNVAASNKKTTPVGKRKKFSFYYLSIEISSVQRGMEIAIGEEHWQSTFASLTTKQLAKKLLWLAGGARWDRLLTNPYSKQKRRKRRDATKKSHVSTQRLLDRRKTRSSR